MPPPRIELGPAAPEAAVISISPRGRGRAESAPIHDRVNRVDRVGEAGSKHVSPQSIAAYGISAMTAIISS